MVAYKSAWAVVIAPWRLRAPLILSFSKKLYVYTHFFFNVLIIEYLNFTNIILVFEFTFTLSL